VLACSRTRRAACLDAVGRPSQGDLHPPSRKISFGSTIRASFPLNRGSLMSAGGGRAQRFAGTNSASGDRSALPRGSEPSPIASAARARSRRDPFSRRRWAGLEGGGQSQPLAARAPQEGLHGIRRVELAALRPEACDGSGQSSWAAASKHKPAVVGAVSLIVRRGCSGAGLVTVREAAPTVAALAGRISAVSACRAACACAQ